MKGLLENYFDILFFTPIFCHENYAFFMTSFVTTTWTLFGKIKYLRVRKHEDILITLKTCYRGVFVVAVFLNLITGQTSRLNCSSMCLNVDLKNTMKQCYVKVRR